MDDDIAQRNSHPLKVCDKCGKLAEPVSGISMGKKWFCAKCWIAHLNLR